MKKKIIGVDSAYREAIEKPGENMMVSANLIVEMSEWIETLESAVIDLRASLRACQNTSNAVMEQYKDL